MLAAMARVVVTGAASALGRRVRELLAERDETDVVGLDLRSGSGIDPTDLVTAPLGPAFAGADAVIHLASVFGPALDGPEVDDAVEVAMARRVLDAAGEAGVLGPASVRRSPRATRQTFNRTSNNV